MITYILIKTGIVEIHGVRPSAVIIDIVRPDIKSSGEHALLEAPYVSIYLTHPYPNRSFEGVHATLDDIHQ